MEKLGEYLKAAREKKGKSLSEMAEKTRISLSFLEALEKDDYRAIPGDVFVSGFLRSYARELGLSQKDVMARFRQAVGEEKAEQPEEIPLPPVLKKVSGPKKSSRFLYTGLAVIAALLAVYMITGQKEESPTPVPKAPAVNEAAKETVTSPEETGPAPAGEAMREEEVAPEEEAETEAKPAVEPEKGVKLKLTASEQTWFHMTVDGIRTTDAILKPGESVELKAIREILLDLGNAGGVEIEYNGKILEPLGPMGTVRRNLLFTPEKGGFTVKPPKAKDPAPMKSRTLGPA